jgi:AcrR family transcriptional regulator
MYTGRYNKYYTYRYGKFPIMKTTSASPKLKARDRLLAAADELFYGQGINSTGVDEISSRAGVTKATLYNNFSGKEELIATYLDRRLAQWLVDANRVDDPRASSVHRVGALFSMLQQSVTASDFRGCPFTNAAVERPDSATIIEVVSRYRRDLVEHVAAMLSGPAARNTADLIVMLYDGALVSAKTTGDRGAVERARELAMQLASS